MTTPKIAVAQGIFDIVVEKAASMPCQSREPNGTLCLYRGPDGNRCFAGWVLPDEAVTGEDGTVLFGDVNQLKGAGKLPSYLDDHLDLLEALQEAHDTHENWYQGGRGKPSQLMPRSLRRIAELHGLKADVVDTFFPG